MEPLPIIPTIREITGTMPEGGMDPAILSARYRTDWPLRIKKATLAALCHSARTSIEDLLLVSGKEYQADIVDPGGLAWSLEVHHAVCKWLLDLMSWPMISRYIYSCGGLAIETLYALFALKIRGESDRTLRRIYSNEVNQRMLLTVRLELHHRGIQPTAQPDIGKCFRTKKKHKR